MDYPKSVPNVGLVDGKFVDEDTSTGTVGSLIPSEWGNAVTDELLGVIVWAGLTPDENNPGQVKQALEKMAVGRLLGVKVFTSSGIYTPTAGTTKVLVKLQGGGGGGGGTQAVSTSQAAVAGAGNAGAYAESLISAGFSGASITVGQAGVSAAASAGTAGGTSSFGALVSAPGGKGGAVGAAGSIFPIGASPQTPSLATGGNIVNAPECASSVGIALSAAGALRAMGGNSLFGSSSYSSTSVGYGAGGSGATAAGGPGAVGALSGYNGAPGIVFVEEYA